MHMRQNSAVIRELHTESHGSPQEWELYKRLHGIAGAPSGLPCGARLCLASAWVSGRITPQGHCSERRCMTITVYDFGVIMLKDDENRELRLRPYMSMQVRPRSLHAL